MKGPTVIAILGIWTVSLAASDVEFFYTQTNDTCEYEDHYIQADEMAVHGGICAWRNDVTRVYGCPAPDPLCWTWQEQCNESQIGQVLCNKGGTVWCCNAVAGETCTTTAGQINVCISNFTSPNSGIDVDAANAAYASAIGVSNVAAVTATSQSVDPTPFSTRMFDVVSQSSTITTLTTPTTSTSAASMTASNTASNTANETPSASAAVSNSAGQDTPASSSISGGAIAGIVIGAIAAMGIVAIAILLFMRRNKGDSSKFNSEKVDRVRDSSEMATTAPTSGRSSVRNAFGNFYGKDQKYDATNELGSDGGQRTELPTHRSYAAPKRFEMP